MKDKFALLFLMSFLLVAPISKAKADDNTIGTDYEKWDKGISMCMNARLLEGGMGCQLDSGQGVTFEQFVNSYVGPQGYTAKVTGLDVAVGGIAIHYVFSRK